MEELNVKRRWSTLPQLFIYTTTHCSLLRLIVRSVLDVPTSATTRVTTQEHPAAEGWNCGREMSGKFYLNADFHVTFKDLLHSVKLRHWTDGFTSPPKEDVLRTFSSSLKIRRLRPGFESANLGTKGKHATSRPSQCHLIPVIIFKALAYINTVCYMIHKQAI
jgi:hypothetical protein